MKVSTRFKHVVKTTLLVAACGIAAQGHAQEVVKVGVLLSLSGPAAPFGIPERDVVKILADKYNADGGINGRKLELVYHDDQTNPTESARGATKLIQQDKVQVIIGPTAGSAALAMLPIAAANQVPVLAPVGTISVTAKENNFFPWVFRTCTNDEILVAGAMEKGVFKAGYKKIAIMYQEDAYGKNSSAYATKLAKEKNVDVIATASAPGNAVDLTAAATRIRNANPDGVVLWTSSPAMGAAFMRAAKQVGLTAPVVGSGALLQRSFIDAAGGAAENVALVSIANWDDPSPKVANLGKLLRANGKTPSGFGELLTTSGIVALAEALKKVQGPVTGAKIRDALENVCDIENPYVDGRFCYNKSSHEGFGTDALTPVVVKDGKFKSMSAH